MNILSLHSQTPFSCNVGVKITVMSRLLAGTLHQTARTTFEALLSQVQEFLEFRPNHSKTQEDQKLDNGQRLLKISSTINCSAAQLGVSTICLNWMRQRDSTNVRERESLLSVREETANEATGRSCTSFVSDKDRKCGWGNSLYCLKFGDV